MLGGTADLFVRGALSITNEALLLTVAIRSIIHHETQWVQGALLRLLWLLLHSHYSSEPLASRHQTILVLTRLHVIILTADVVRLRRSLH